MKINISGHHVEITEALQSHVDDKMLKLTRHFDNISNPIGPEYQNQYATGKVAETPL